MTKRKTKIDIDEMNKRIVREKMKDPLYVLSDLDRYILNVPYRSKKRRKK